MGDVIQLDREAQRVAWSAMLTRKAEWEAAVARGADPAQIIGAEKKYLAARAEEERASRRCKIMKGAT